jgi:hypothetical protein
MNVWRQNKLANIRDYEYENENGDAQFAAGVKVNGNSERESLGSRASEQAQRTWTHRK